MENYERIFYLILGSLMTILIPSSFPEKQSLCQKKLQMVIINSEIKDSIIEVQEKTIDLLIKNAK